MRGTGVWTTVWTGDTNLGAHTVRWEPCAAFPDPDPAGVCCDCGWPPEDHEAPIAPVVALRRIPEALPRAS